MERQHERQKPEPDPKPEDYKPEWETYTELETLNSMVPIWKKQKSEVTDEEYANFYKEKFGDYTDPPASSSAAPRALQIIMPCCSCPATVPTTSTPRIMKRVWPCTHPACSLWRSVADLLPDYFSFVKGIVDSQDLSLNISREMLQKDNQLKLIHNALEKKIKNGLHAMLANDRESTRNSGRSSAVRSSSVLTPTTACTPSCCATCCCSGLPKEQKMVTLQEYVDKMPAEQKYLLCGR